MSEIERSESSDERAPESPAPVPPSGEDGPFPSGYIEIQRSGMLPPPVEFREYAMLITDGADRMMQMAEREQLHEHRISHRQETRASVGVACATLSVLGTLALAGFGFYTGHAVEGAAVFGTTIGAIVAVFIRGTSTKKE